MAEEQPTQTEQTVQSQYKKADLFKRFLALFIDALMVWAVSIIPFIGWIIGTAYFLFRDGLDWDFMKNRSLGKKLMKLKIVVLEGPLPAPDLKISFMRNWIFALPTVLTIIPLLGVILALPLALVIYLVEGIKVTNDASGRRYGDDFAKTMVVEE